MTQGLGKMFHWMQSWQQSGPQSIALPVLSLGENKSHFLLKGDVTLPQKELYLFSPIHHYSFPTPPGLSLPQGAHIYHVCSNLHCVSVCHDDWSLPNKSAWMVAWPLSPSASDGRCGCSVNHPGRCWPIAAGAQLPEGSLSMELCSVEEAPVYTLLQVRWRCFPRPLDQGMDLCFCRQLLCFLLWTLKSELGTA